MACADDRTRQIRPDRQSLALCLIIGPLPPQHGCLLLENNLRRDLPNVLTQIGDPNPIIPDWESEPADCEKPAMSALGHKRTSSDDLSNVRYWGQSGHWMSAFRDRCNFPPPMSAFGGKADALTHLSACPLIAISGPQKLLAMWKGKARSE